MSDTLPPVVPCTAGPAHVTTRGLKWDMDATRLAVGHLVRGSCPSTLSVDLLSLAPQLTAPPM
jgi:hypothetical protein